MQSYIIISNYYTHIYIYIYIYIYISLFGYNSLLLKYINIKKKIDMHVFQIYNLQSQEIIYNYRL